MTPATDLEAKAALERFARLSTEEKAAELARGRLIQTLDDLEGLPEAEIARLGPIIEQQTPKS